MSQTSNIPLEEVAAIFGDRVAITLDGDSKVPQVDSIEEAESTQLQPIEKVAGGYDHIEGTK